MISISSSDNKSQTVTSLCSLKTNKPTTKTNPQSLVRMFLRKTAIFFILNDPCELKLKLISNSFIFLIDTKIHICECVADLKDLGIDN